MDKDERDRLLKKLSERKSYASANRGVQHLVTLWQSGDYRLVPTRELRAKCRATPYEWPATHRTLREILWLHGLDLVNTNGVGYGIAIRPRQTLAEIIKSMLRSMGHYRSGQRRREWFEKEWLDQLDSPEEKVALAQLDVFLGLHEALERHQGAILRKALISLDLEGLEEEVANPAKARDPAVGEDPDAATQDLLRDIFKDLQAQFLPALPDKNDDDDK